MLESTSEKKILFRWQRAKYLLPLSLFVVLFFLLWHGLSVDPQKLPSTLINEPAPEFSLPLLHDSKMQLTNKTWQGEVALVNVWASWCTTCEAEHAFLMDIARSNQVAMYGIDYKDQHDSAMLWLQTLGNPYHAVGFDQKGLVSIDWGVYGTPESFLIDKHGVVRYKVIGPITPELWQSELLPLIQKLQRE